MIDTLVGIDVGTTWCKAAVVSVAGRELAHHRRRVAWRTVPTGAEIDAERLFEVAVRAGSAAIRRAAPARVVALGVTGMAETGALLDANGEVVTPGIAWYDARGVDEAESLRSDLGEERFGAVTGLPASRLCTLAKYRWLRTHEPAAARGARWLNVGEWVVRRLGGEEVADLSLISLKTVLPSLPRSAREEADFVHRLARWPAIHRQSSINFSTSLGSNLKGLLPGPIYTAGR
jgi:sugar (pentulose or hexulose) kinase